MVAFFSTCCEKFIIALIYAYRFAIRPYLGPSCRFDPSCSAYALEAVRRWGPFRGGWMAGKRLLRCHPFSPGGCDPVPKQTK